uniref:Uncharacterized protein n=1 Tax=Candidatus Kentrum sp. MB TaxID=2138164 RepID=A0A450X5X7_9GAMM|nr:MAG: hypothetical protein BECKMB1821G_GA0114241_100924 [Candidatus Kentron sp. MB]VFK27072.1 MAG: hypothetical protein BECKMB1821I_GA0114274_100228 [Candidatus Kentron sp. MB]VFK74916.1 MAG: hypothetical protein BECKMB1821H_GA0114242_101225 [Candidatus Kentron sp. MB]
MKQLYHTSCKKGFSANGNSGFQVRAVTVGFPDGRIRAMLPFVGYEIPLANIDRNQLPEIAPTRLALFEAPNVGRITIHGVYVGQDPTTGRDGNYFSHLLCDVPDSVSAANVLQTWGSSVWQTHDNDSIDKQLGELETLPCNGSLNEQGVSNFLCEPRHQEMFRFLLNAWLTLPEGGRIFLAANSEDVAICLWGLTRCLPDSLQRNLTFSTYEKNPLTSFARVVGAWWGDVQARDLPHACYTGRNLGFNGFTDRPPSMLPKTLAYVDFIVASCSEGNISSIDKFHANINSEVLGNIEHLDRLYRILHKPDAVTAEELRSATEISVLRECIIEHPGAVAKLTRVAVSDPRYAQGAFSSFVKELNHDPIRRKQVCDVAVEVVCTAAENDERQTLEAFFSGFVPSLENPLKDKVLNDTWEQLRTPSELRPDSFSVLLPQALSWYTDKKQEDKINQWLTVSLKQLPTVLSANVGQAFKVRACLNICDDRKECANELSIPIQAHPKLVIPVMKGIVERPTLGEACSKDFFRTVVGKDRSQDVANELLASGSQLPSELFDYCLEQCLNCGCLTAQKVASSQWHSLPLSDERRLSLCEAIISEYKINELVNDAISSEFLGELTKIQSTPAALRTKVKSLLAIRRFITGSQMTSSGCQELADALRNYSSPNEQQALTKLLSQQFTKRLFASQEADQAWELLESFLISVGGVAEYPALYTHILSQAGEEPTFWKEPLLLHAFLACGFGVSTQGSGVPWRGDLAKNAEEFAKQLAKKGGRRIFRKVYRESQSWRKIGADQQFQQWRNIAKRIEPISIWQRTGKAFANGSKPVGRLLRRAGKSIADGSRQVGRLFPQDDDHESHLSKNHGSGNSSKWQQPKRTQNPGHESSEDGSGGKTRKTRMGCLLYLFFVAIIMLLPIWALNYHFPSLFPSLLEW